MSREFTPDGMLYPYYTDRTNVSVLLNGRQGSWAQLFYATFG